MIAGLHQNLSIRKREVLSQPSYAKTMSHTKSPQHLGNF